MTTSQIDGTWDLAITVTDLLVQSPDPIEKTLRVRGDTHLGAVILQITECFDGADQIDWSNFALWWPEKKRWLLKSRSTLDQCGIQSDSHLMFTPTHKNIDLQLPDLQRVTLNVDFSLSLFRVVRQLCKEIGIRHPEELSLARHLSAGELKKNFVPQKLNQRRKQYEQSKQLQNGGFNPTSSPRRTPSVPGTPQGTLMRTPGSPYTTLSHNGTLSPGSTHSLSFADPTNFDSSFIHSPQFELCELLDGLYKVKGYAEKARVNYGWLDSSLSLYEQDINEGDLVILRYKYSCFYDLNSKYDSVRINQLYEQLKNSLIIEDFDCTNEEMIMFAAFQLQIQSNAGQDGLDGQLQNGGGGEDEVDAALNDLQLSLDVGNMNDAGAAAARSPDITSVPELCEYLKYYKPKKFQLKSYKKHFFVFKDTNITMYKNKKQESVLLTHNLKGCEVVPELNIAAQKFVIKLFVPTCDDLQEFWIRCEHEDQYTKWLAACRCASKGKSMADLSFINETKSIASFIKLQRPSTLPSDQVDGAEESLKIENFVPAKHIKKLQTKQIARRIIDSKNKIGNMSCTEAKLNYIKAIQSLPDFGVAYFIVKMKDSKKEEILGIASNRCILMDLNNGTVLKTWPFKMMQSWSVNWELRQVEIVVEGNKVCFRPLSADCKVVHEFIGAYIFLAMRSAERSQTLDEPLFQKLTGGWE